MPSNADRMAWIRHYSLFPTHSYGHFRCQVRNHQCGSAIYGQRHRGAARAVRQFNPKMTGSWDLVFIIAAGANIAAAVLAVAVLKPWRTRVIRRSSEQIETSPEMAPRPA